MPRSSQPATPLSFIRISETDFFLFVAVIYCVLFMHLCAGTCVYDVLGHIFVLLEVLVEFLCESLCGSFVCCLVCPYISGIENLCGYIRAGLGNIYIEDGVERVLNIVEFACESRRNHGTRIFELHSRNIACLAAAPTCIYKEYIGACFLQLLAEHCSINTRIEREERSTEERGECCHRLCDAALCACKLGGVTGNEVVHSHIVVKLCDGRENAESICREEDDCLGLTAYAGDSGIGDIVYRIACACVLCERAVIVIGLAVFIDDNILEKRTEFDSVVDFRLMLFLEVDSLCIAAALDIEDAVCRPAVLVITDELSCGVCGERCLACAGETEEYGGIACFADICGAVHGEKSLLGKNIVHNGEYALLYFAGILAACDKNEVSLIVDGDERLAVSTVNLGNALEARSRDYFKIGCVCFKFFLCGTDKKLMNEEVLGSKLVYYTEFLRIFGVCACKTVEYIELLILEICEHFCLDGIEFFLGYRSVYLAPVDIVVYCGSINDEFVFGGTTCVLACLYNKRACIGKNTLTVCKSLFRKSCGAEIAINLAVACYSEFNGFDFSHNNFLLGGLSFCKKPNFRLIITLRLYHTKSEL